MNSFEQVQAVGAIATKEYSMLKTMEKMEAEWSGLDFRVMPYKDTGVLEKYTEVSTQEST